MRTGGGASVPGLRRIERAIARQRRDADLVGMLPDVVERLAGGLRAGAAPLPALGEAATSPDLPEVLREDLRRVVDRAGDIGLGPALDLWAAERPVPPVTAVAAALQVTASTGGPAAPALEGLAGGLRDRHDVAGEVAALSAQARMSAIVVGAAPLVSLALSLLADPRVAPTLLGTAPGRACLMAGITLEGLAAWWMGRIVRYDP